MQDSSFTFSGLVHRSGELNRKKAEMHILIQLVAGSIKHEASNVSIHINRDFEAINGFKYTWGIGDYPKHELVLMKWRPGVDFATGNGTAVWWGKNANDIPAKKVDEIYASMDHLLQQSIRFIDGFKQRLIDMAILQT